MTKKKLTLSVRGEDFSLEPFTDEEKGNLLILVRKDPLLLNLYVLRELLTIKKRLGSQQWTHRYTELLDTAKTDKLIGQFPTQPKYLYVKSNSGTVTAKFNSANEPSFSLTTKDLIRLPFSKLYLSWIAQPNKCLTFYISNKEIKMSTLP